jgi:hypothetical protein
MATKVTNLELEFEEDATASRKEQVSQPEDLGIDFTTSTNITSPTKVISSEEVAAATQAANSAPSAGQEEPDNSASIEVKPMPYNSPSTPNNIVTPPRPTRYLAELRKAKLNKTIYKKRSLFSRMKASDAPHAPAAESPAASPPRPNLAPAPLTQTATNIPQVPGQEVSVLETEIRVAVAQAQGEMLAEVLSEAKLLTYQIEHILKKFKTTNPQLLQYIKQIRLLLQEFIKKDFIK